MPEENIVSKCHYGTTFPVTAADKHFSTACLHCFLCCFHELRVPKNQLLVREKSLVMVHLNIAGEFRRSERE